jgi:site-specific recombinase XerD
LLAYQATRTPDDHPALFTGVHGNRLSPTIMGAAFRRYAEAAGVSRRKRVTPDTLRHVVATELLGAAPTRDRSSSCSGTSTWTPRSATRT